MLPTPGRSTGRRWRRRGTPASSAIQPTSPPAAAASSPRPTRIGMFGRPPIARDRHPHLRSAGRNQRARRRYRVGEVPSDANPRSPRRRRSAVASAAPRPRPTAGRRRTTVVRRGWRRTRPASPALHPADRCSRRTRHRRRVASITSAHSGPAHSDARLTTRSSGDRSRPGVAEPVDFDRGPVGHLADQRTRQPEQARQTRRPRPPNGRRPGARPRPTDRRRSRRSAPPGRCPTMPAAVRGPLWRASETATQPSAARHQARRPAAAQTARPSQEQRRRAFGEHAQTSLCRIVSSSPAPCGVELLDNGADSRRRAGSGPSSRDR